MEPTGNGGGPAPPTSEEFAVRNQAVAEACVEAGLDGLIVWSRGATAADGWSDVLYLSGHMTPVTHIADSDENSARGYCGLVFRPGEPTVLVTDAYDTAAEDVHAGELRITTRVDVTTAEVARELGLSGQGVGIAGASSLLHTSFARIEEILGRETRLSFADPLLTDIRMIKSPYEIELLRAASRIGCGWVDAMLDACTPGMTEGDVVGEGLRFLAEAGGWPFDVAIASGPQAYRYRSRQALPTWDPARRLAEGELVHIDAWGPVVHGYYCDLTRSTVAGGSPTEAQDHLIGEAIQMIEHLIAGIEPGLPLSALHARGMEWLEHRGGGGSEFAKMIPFVGHSLGLEVEAPFISASEERTIAPGMVLALECFLGDGASTAAGFEQVVAVNESDVEILTSDSAARPWAR